MTKQWNTLQMPVQILEPESRRVREFAVKLFNPQPAFRGRASFVYFRTMDEARRHATEFVSLVVGNTAELIHGETGEILETLLNKGIIIRSWNPSLALAS